MHGGPVGDILEAWRRGPEFFLLITNQFEFQMNSNQPKISDLLKKNLQNLKMKIDSNQQEIEDCNQLLSQIKKNCDELDSLANKISQ